MTKAEYDQSVVLRLRVAREQKRAEAKDHRCEGRKPYGSLSGETVILTRIQHDRAAGMTLQAIARGLNAQGIPPRMRRPVGPNQSPPRWHAKTIARIVARLPVQGMGTGQRDDQSDSLFPGDRVYQARFKRVSAMAESLRQNQRKRAPFGYEKMGDLLLKIPAEQDVIARIKNLWGTKSNAEIATTLNDEQAATPKGSREWTASKIQKIIFENGSMFPGTGTNSKSVEPRVIDSRTTTFRGVPPAEPTPDIPFGYEWQTEDDQRPRDLMIRQRVTRKPVGLRRLRSKLTDFDLVKSAEEQKLIASLRHLHDAKSKPYSTIAALLKTLVEVPEALVESPEEQAIVRRVRSLHAEGKRYREIAALLDE